MRVALSQKPVPPVPEGRLFVVEGSGDFSDEDWKKLSVVPGAFFLDKDGPIPASGNIAWGMRATNGRWPEPVYVPEAQAMDLHDALPSIGVWPRSVPWVHPFVHSIPKATERLFPFQEEAVRRFLQDRRMPLLLPVGSGKTVPAIFAGEELRALGLTDRTVVIAPKTLLRTVWAPALKRFYDIEPVFIDGPAIKRAKAWQESLLFPWTLSKYDTYRTDERAIRKVLGPRTMVIIEEVHHLKDPTTKRWRAIRDLLDETGVDYRLFLTGTLLHDKPVDAFGPLSLLGLHLWNTYAEFRDRYFSVDRFPTGKFDRWGKPIVVEAAGELKGPEEARRLREVIDRVSFRKTRKEVNLELPPLRQEVRIIEATPEEEKLYEKVIVPLGVENVSTERILATIAMERLFSSDPSLILRSPSDTAKELVAILGQDAFESISPGSKIRAFVDFLDDFLEEDSGSKVVVFSQIKDIYDRLIQWLDKSQGSPYVVLRSLAERDWIAEEWTVLLRIADACVFFHGGLSDKERSERLERFLHDPGRRILFSTDIGGEGIDGLQGVASHVVHYEDSTSLGKFEQRIGRVWRRGQPDPVLSIRFELSPEKKLGEALSRLDRRFVDACLRDLIEWKMGQRRLVLGEE